MTLYTLSFSHREYETTDIQEFLKFKLFLLKAGIIPKTKKEPHTGVKMSLQSTKWF